MMDITVKVPEDRIADFYQMYGAWLNDQMQPESPPSGETTEGDRDHLPWTESDTEQADAVWRKLSDAARRLFSTFIAEPGRRFSGEELATMLDIPNGKHGVAGVLAWPGRHSFKQDREWPWRWEYPVEGEPAVYWFEPEIAALFRDARDRQG
jgi:hypothetical protein